VASVDYKEVPDHLLVLPPGRNCRVQKANAKTTTTLKPANFVFGRGSEGHNLYLIDFGFAKKFHIHDNQTRMSCLESQGMTGTPLFASANAHMGLEQSRRDDIQALGYVAA